MTRTARQPLAPHPALAAEFASKNRIGFADALRTPDAPQMSRPRDAQDIEEYVVVGAGADQRPSVSLVVENPPQEQQPVPAQAIAPAVAAAPAVAPHVEARQVAAAQPAAGVQAPAPQSAQPDPASLVVPAKVSEVGDQVRRKGSKSIENAVDLSLSLSQEHHSELIRLTAMEMIRLGRKVSTSELVRHFISHGLSHAVGGHVVPTSDGLGLHPHAGV